MADVFLKYVNSVYIKVIADPGIILEMSEYFTYFAPNYKFQPKYKAKVWDGKIRLLNTLTGAIYAGLAKRIKKFCDDRDYTIEFDPMLVYEDVSEFEIKEHIKSLNIPEKYQSRDYQLQSIIKCIRTGRRTLISPTSSGKSLMMYIISQWYKNEKALIIVPTIGLVNQLQSDFRDYGYEGVIAASTDGLPKSNDIPCDMVITTWQSLNNGKSKMPRAWYEQFGLVFGDEAHGAKAACLISILTSLDCKYRFGTTGTLQDELLPAHTIEGLFGPTFRAISTSEMIDQGFASKLQIKCIILKYDDEECKDVVSKKYAEEIDFLVNHPYRNKFIANLTLSLEGNKLLFFRIIDQGKTLFDLISKKTNHNVFYIDGSVKGDVREDIRKAIEDEQNAVLVASMGTTSTGVSINRLHHMIAASPSKSKIKILQSIGRMLRLHTEKDEHGAVLYDIVDDLQYKSKTNYTLEHFKERMKIYTKENFPVKIYTVRIKNGRTTTQP